MPVCSGLYVREVKLQPNWGWFVSFFSKIPFFLTEFMTPSKLFVNLCSWNEWPSTRDVLTNPVLKNRLHTVTTCRTIIPGTRSFAVQNIHITFRPLGDFNHLLLRFLSHLIIMVPLDISTLISTGVSTCCSCCHAKMLFESPLFFLHGLKWWMCLKCHNRTYPSLFLVSWFWQHSASLLGMEGEQHQLGRHVLFMEHIFFPYEGLFWL